MLNTGVHRVNGYPKFEITHNYSFNFEILDLILDLRERFIVVVGSKFLRFVSTKSGALASGLNRRSEQIILFKSAIQSVEHIPPKLKVNLGNNDTRIVDYCDLKRIEEVAYEKDFFGFEHEQLQCIVGKPERIPYGIMVAGITLKLAIALSLNPTYALVLPRYSVLLDELGNFILFRREGELLVPHNKNCTANVYQTALFRKMTGGYFVNTYDADENINGHAFALFGGKNMLLGEIRESRSFEN